MITMYPSTEGTPVYDPTVSDYVKLVRYCALGFDLRILDEDAIIRRVDAFCKERNIGHATHVDIIRAIIENAYRVSKKSTRALLEMLEECETSQWKEDVHFVIWAEISRRDRAAGITQ